jgi:molybdenum cofactor cytidylyltransferase
LEGQYDIILLAAGSSSRLGSPKQLLLYNGNTLIKHSIDAAQASVAQRVVVVLGANALIIQPEFENHKLHFVINDNWQSGMASSIRCGLNYLLKLTPITQHVLFMVCDQPYINTSLLNKLMTLQRQTGSAIVASQYAETIGIPAVFDKTLFTALLQLEGDTGARKLIEQQRSNVDTVSFPMGDIDIDTKADYKNLQKASKKNDNDLYSRGRKH